MTQTKLRFQSIHDFINSKVSNRYDDIYRMSFGNDKNASNFAEKAIDRWYHVWDANPFCSSSDVKCYTAQNCASISADVAQAYGAKVSKETSYIGYPDPNKIFNNIANNNPGSFINKAEYKNASIGALKTTPSAPKTNIFKNFLKY